MHRENISVKKINIVVSIIFILIAEYCKRNEVSHEENEYDEETTRII